MRTLALVMLALALGTSATSTAASRNPFAPQPVTAPEAPSRAAPPADLPPRIPPPPVSLRLPPVVPMKRMPPLPAPASSAPAAQAKPALPAREAASDGEAPGRTKAEESAVFRTREDIEKGRAACQPTLRSPTSLKAAAEGATLRVLFGNSSARPCFMAMQSDRPWAIARTASATAVDIEVQPNPTRHMRSTRVVIATANERWTLLLTQAPGADDVEELDLEASDPDTQP